MQSRTKTLVVLLLCGSTLLAIAATPTTSNSWKFKTGLWEMTLTQVIVFPPIPPNTPPQDRANLKAFQDSELAKKPFVTQFCQSNTGNITQSIFDPANQPPGVCTEKVTAESPTDREVENDCALPISSFGQATPTEPPRVHVQASRHIVLHGEGEGTIDRMKITAGQSGSTTVTRELKWIATECTLAPTSPR